MAINQISGTLDLQQKTVSIVDEYIQSILSGSNYSTNHDFYADFVMQHIFVNIRNSYQDGLFISQGLIKNAPYYVSTSLSHALRSAQEFLVDLAYIVRDIKNKSGHEYLRYLKFIVDKETKISGENGLTDDQYNEFFPPNLDLEPKSSSQWSHTNAKVKIKEGLKFYKIELPHFTDFRSKFHLQWSSTAHGNKDTIYTFLRTPEENRLKLEADLTSSAGLFDITLLSALECYVKLYLGRNKDYREIIKSMFPSEYLQFHKFQAQIKDSYRK